MIQIVSDLRVALLLLCLLVSPAFADEDDVSVELSPTVSVRVTNQDSPQTIADRMNQLSQKLEDTNSKYNIKHRMRVARREMNASDGQADIVPVGAILFNGSAAMIGVHALESFAIGPALIGISEIPGMPDMIALGLKAWGTALINPMPLGPWIDWATESFCWMTLVVVRTDAFHRGVYWVEMTLVKVGGALAKAVGMDRVWHALMEKQSGFERLVQALERGDRELEYNAEDLSFRFRNSKGRDLARVKLRLTNKFDVRLDEFELYSAAATPDGRRDLAKQLKIFGTDIRDAILQPGQLVIAGHGEQLEGKEVWRARGNSVLLGPAWRPNELCRTIAAEAWRP